MISVRNLRKVYKLKSGNVTALNGVNVDFPDTGLVFLLGKSGSGKSTLLNTIGGLDTFDEGEIIIKGKSSKSFKQSDFDSYRNTFIGFIFQEYNILEEFSVGKNLALALELQGKKANKNIVNKLLEEVDLAGYYKRKPNQLSGGQKQRVAIARALIKDPEIIMADEPTGALDSNTGKQVMDTLKKLSQHKLVIIVSHDREFAEIYGDRIIELKDGNIISDQVKIEVPAQKSASGVSFIDNKIIHIKKGQQITREDLIKINQMIVKNTGYEDTIISFDQKSNTDVKKSAFITDEGNREVFKATTSQDIRRIAHDPKNFKMTKSKLKFKDSFKMGASSLKTKPIRLIFTILLSVVAFTMFGVVNTASQFNRGDAVYATCQELDIKTLAINKNRDYYNKFNISSSDVQKFQNDNKNYDLHQVVGSGKNFSVSGLYSSGSNNYNVMNTLKRDTISGIMVIDDDIKNYFNLELVDGRLPIANNEICISVNIFNTIKSQYSGITSLESLEGKQLNIYNCYYDIVGILKDDTNIERYANLTGNESNRKTESSLWEELNVVMNYGLINMCYTNLEGYNRYKDSSSNQSQQYQAYAPGADYCNYSNNFSYHIANTTTTGLTWSRNGATYQELASNLTKYQAILPEGFVMNVLGISRDELIEKLNAGLNLNFSYGYDGCKAPAFELEIVGCCSNYNDIYVSEEFYNSYIEGCDYLITRLKGNSEDKSIIKYFENYKDKTFNYNVQFQSTTVLDNFGGMIEDMAKILLYVGIGLAAFAGLMLMNFISTSITYKKREIGVLRAIGARGKDVFSIFFSESFVICLINFILSAIGTGVVSSIINNSFASELNISLTLMMFGFKQIALLFVIALGVAFASSFLPVYKFARKNPIDSINNR